VVQVASKTGYDFDKSQHAVYSLQYHLIVCTKYRRKVFDDPELVDFLKGKVHGLSENRDIRVLEVGVDGDHFHMVFRADPTTNLADYVRIIKGSTSKSIRHQFPEVKEKLGQDSFWSKSYCLMTTGEVTLDKLQEYVESQGEKR
jgi:REP element-mobilizing transposase RayT